MASQLREISFADMRSTMVDCQLRTNDVIDPAIVGVMGAVPRENFVPSEMASLAYIDRPIMLTSARRMNAPLVTARLLVAADIRAGQRVLLIGAASGYTAALLAGLGAVVVAVESDAALMQLASAALSEGSVTLISGALCDGAVSEAPFDRIVIDGAIEVLPDQLADQLVDGGICVAALTDGPVTRLARGIKIGGAVVLRPFADMDAVTLPGFSRPAGFAF